MVFATVARKTQSSEVICSVTILWVTDDSTLHLYLLEKVLEASFLMWFGRMHLISTLNKPYLYTVCSHFVQRSYLGYYRGFIFENACQRTPPHILFEIVVSNPLSPLGLHVLTNIISLFWNLESCFFIAIW